MSRKVIAIVTLGQGSTAYYDEITGMHLTLSNPTGYVYEDINFTGIKRAVKNKTLKLVNGTFNVQPEQKSEQGFVEEQIIPKKTESKKVVESTKSEIEETIEVAPKKASKNKASSKKDKKGNKSESEETSTEE